jgi:transposase-like protein
MAKKGPKVKGKPLASGAIGSDGEKTVEKVARLERELAAANKEIDSLRMDREILKKAAAFFAKESE